MDIETTVEATAALPVRWLGITYTVAVTGPGASLGAFESLVPAGGGPPLHVHHGEDEAIHVIDGEVEFWLDGRILRRGSGQGVFLPRSVPHCFRVLGDRPARFLGMVTPGGFEGFFAAAAAAGVGPHDPAALAAFGARWRVEFLGPPPFAR
jgi:mannose-6-phosphate isomerase-like protein (cupin superfamily)